MIVEVCLVVVLLSYALASICLWKMVRVYRRQATEKLIEQMNAWTGPSEENPVKTILDNNVRQVDKFIKLFVMFLCISFLATILGVCL